MTTQDEKEDVVCDLALIQPLNGLYIGQLTLTEMELLAVFVGWGLQIQNTVVAVDFLAWEKLNCCA